MVSIYYPPYGFGGDAIYLHRLCNELVNQGHEVDVIHCADSYHMFVPTVDPDAFPAGKSVRVHQLESGVGMLSPLLSHQTGRPWLKTRRILDIFRSKRFDVIHYHNISLFGPRVLEINPPYPQSSSTQRTSTGSSARSTFFGRTAVGRATARPAFPAPYARRGRHNCGAIRRCSNAPPPTSTCFLPPVASAGRNIAAAVFSGKCRFCLISHRPWAAARTEVWDRRHHRPPRKTAQLPAGLRMLGPTFSSWVGSKRSRASRRSCRISKRPATMICWSSAPAAIRPSFTG